MDTPVHLASVPARSNPGGLWVRQCTWTQLLEQGPLGRAGIIDGGDVHGAIDRLRAEAVRTSGEKVWTYLYDGETGECVGTLETVPEDVEVEP